MILIEPTMHAASWLFLFAHVVCARDQNRPVMAYRGSKSQCMSIIKFVKRSNVAHVPHGYAKCAYEYPHDDLVVKFVYHGTKHFRWQQHLNAEVAAYVYDPLHKPTLKFYCGHGATYVTNHQHGAARGPVASSRDEQCGGLRTYSDQYIYDHIPFLVLKRTRRGCADASSQSAVWSTLISSLERDHRPMIVQYDKVQAFWSSDCDVIFYDFDSTCYNAADKRELTAEEPFPVLSNRSWFLIEPCSDWWHGEAMSFKATVLKNWKTKRW